MNINKILSAITFDDFLKLIDEYVNYLHDNKQAYIRLLKDDDTTENKINHRLFIYFMAVLYKKEVYYHNLLYSDPILKLLADKDLLTEEILDKFKHLFVKITPEINTYLRYNLSEKDKEFLNHCNNLLLKDFFKLNENLIGTDKDFFLDYIKYVNVPEEYFNLFLQVYPELKEAKPSDIQFFIQFWHRIIYYNSNCIPVNFLYNYYQIIPDIALSVLTCKSVFYKLSEQCRKKIKEKINSQP